MYDIVIAVTAKSGKTSDATYIMNDVLNVIFTMQDRNNDVTAVHDDTLYAEKFSYAMSMFLASQIIVDV